MGDNSSILDRVYSMEGGPDACRDIYADWAGQYDQDTVGFGYVGPALVAETLAKVADTSTRILDAGCGTGLAGAELAKQGFTRIDGIDVSPEMLEEARGKGVYGELAEADMTRRFPLEDDAYDGAVCVGVFTNGHVGPDAIREIARVVKPGGMIVATVHENVWDKEGYAGELKKMEADGVLKVHETPVAPYHLKEGYECRLCVLEAR
ncbi:class I SAM-dependent DNA methyltransferase [Amorphus orientalis]|uniref:TPR repeat methyltransferase n=1 Tax=Amorphus orientalis TaxID=649198 RepID=A0AAE3VNT5_9HYPH|nr:class I SAM-dependent methyltransferase [Amorphus orientalis]MDQ0315303.1 putative TPR repeat methyltransferase [Amorphus orientalis]